MKPVQILLIAFAFFLAACSHSSNSGNQDPSPQFKNESLESKVHRLRAFLGPKFATAFRSDTCENASSSTASLEYTDDSSLGAGYYNFAVKGTGQTYHIIFGIYLTAKEGVRYVETTRQYYGVEGFSQYYHRDDGQACKAVLNYNDIGRSEVFNPVWFLTDTELTIKSDPEIRIKKVGGDLVVYSADIEQIAQNNPTMHQTEYPVKLDFTGWRSPAKNMPYCDGQIYCNK